MRHPLRREVLGRDTCVRSGRSHEPRLSPQPETPPRSPSSRKRRAGGPNRSPDVGRHKRHSSPLQGPGPSWARGAVPSGRPPPHPIWTQQVCKRAPAEQQGRKISPSPRTPRAHPPVRRGHKSQVGDTHTGGRPELARPGSGLPAPGRGSHPGSLRSCPLETHHAGGRPPEVARPAAEESVDGATSQPGATRPGRLVARSGLSGRVQGARRLHLR